MVSARHDSDKSFFFSILFFFEGKKKTQTQALLQ